MSLMEPAVRFLRPQADSSSEAVLREEILEDADWAEVVDQLNAALRA